MNLCSYHDNLSAQVHDTRQTRFLISNRGDGDARLAAGMVLGSIFK